MRRIAEYQPGPFQALTADPAADRGSGYVRPEEAVQVARRDVRFSEKWLDMIKSLLPVYAREIDSGDYSDAASSVGLFVAGAAHDEELTKETNVDTTWLAPLHDLVERAAAAGHAEHSISALTEVLRGRARKA
ncbi:imine reductase family protein [Streptomyces sp. CMB-StM0423]|uniref:imine reductase family protein n=1 Tax=Streptomyces sp. CMB-StM0423 TaxID=2059884 RepID=UPI0018FEC054|nr:hypothetical protein [Streptomyces sp. CMB-StM0423]